MKKISLILCCLTSFMSVHASANAYQDQFKPIIETQPSAEKFLENYQSILDELEKKADAWNQQPDESPQIWFPICVGYENRITILENNQKYKTAFNAALEEDYGSFDDTLQLAKDERANAEELCQKAHQGIANN